MNLTEGTYKEKYLDVIDVNDFSSNPEFKYKAVIDECLKFALLDEEGEPVALLFAFEYSPSKYMGYIIGSKSKLRSFHARQIKTFVRDKFILYNMTRLETTSLSCTHLTKWHKALGFEFEGTRRKFLGDDNYDMWSMV